MTTTIPLASLLLGHPAPAGLPRRASPAARQLSAHTLPIYEMGSSLAGWAVAILAAVAWGNATAATLYVWQDNSNPAPPYDSWSSAATNIQDAVDFAQTGDVVLVTNGVYATGGRVVGQSVPSDTTNRVVIDKAITVQSVNGPALTVIEGDYSGGGVRCVYLAGDAVLRGFTLTNGYATSSIGGGGVRGGTLYNCILTGNGAYSGGGSYGGTFHNCILTGNSATFGGGSDGGTFYNCILTSNSAWYAGGGVYQSTLYNCILTGNSVTGNYEDYFYYGGGGAAVGGTLHNCAITGNSAPSGGGVREATLYNCTVTGNSAGVDGGGVLASTLYNCIVYFNDAPTGPNHAGAWEDSKTSSSYLPATFYSSCTTPLPLHGEGNIVADPRLITLSHLSDSSPCIGAGSSDYTSGLDIDGEPWADPPCMGADQLTPDAMSGALAMAIRAEYLNIATDFRVTFFADNQGPIVASAWDFDDGTVVSNAPLASHSWNAPGLYTVRLTGYNDSFPEGVTTTVQIEVTEAAVHYVNQNNPTPQFPYTSWATAATNIQTAIDAGTTVGRRILVTNGVYTSGAVQHRGWWNRVALLDPVVVRSVNGPEVTVIEGATGPEGANGDGGIRCAYVGARAILSGFTLTRGQTWVGNHVEASNGGGAWCEPSATLTNCILTDNWASNAGGGAYGGTLRNCTLTRNSAAFGGGASDSTLHNCAVIGNSTHAESGAFRRTADLTTSGIGGGTRGGTLYNCILTDNTASFGGGADGGVLHNCTLTFNSATNSGGGVYRGTLYNCIAYNNTAPSGANYGGSGAYDIVEYELDDDFDYEDLSPLIFYNSCTTPLPPGGENNIDSDPQLATFTHLSSSSPCIGAGSSAYASGMDIDGESWSSPPCIGADQITPGQATGTLVVAIEADYTSLATGFDVQFIARIQGAALASTWDFDDGTVLSNAPLARHAWNLPGSYTVRLTAYNDSFPEGVLATVLVDVTEAIHYVNLVNPTPQFPYTTWSTAAPNIQTAIEAGTTVGRLILVTNGVYASGAVVAQGSNRVALVDPVVVRSVNGPGVTLIEGAPGPEGSNGYGGIRCVYLGPRTILSGFTLTNGHAGTSGNMFRTTSFFLPNQSTYPEWYGGGAWCDRSATLTNCILTGNAAWHAGGGSFGGTLRNCTLTRNAASMGGGASDCTLHNCVLTLNSAGAEGGGSSGGTLFNCTLTENNGGGAAGGNLYNCTVTANYGVGVYHATLFNCIVYFNPLPVALLGAEQPIVANYADQWTRRGCSPLFGCFPTRYSPTILFNSCTSPLPDKGTGNITNAPLFVDFAGGDLRLSSNSPCINAGNNIYVTSSTDLGGDARIASAMVDMGAYEYQGIGSVISYAWLQQYGLPTDGSVDTADLDGDLMNNWQEWLADTDPSDPLSYFHIENISRPSPAMISFESSFNRTYTLWRASQIDPADWRIVSGTQAIPGNGTTLILSDDEGGARGFYRVEVNLP